MTNVNYFWEDMCVRKKKFEVSCLLQKSVLARDYSLWPQMPSLNGIKKQSTLINVNKLLS